MITHKHHYDQIDYAPPLQSASNDNLRIRLAVDNSNDRKLLTIDNSGVTRDYTLTYDNNPL